MRINKQMLLPAVTNAAVAAFAGFQGDTEFAILLGAVAAFCGLKCFGFFKSFGPNSPFSA